MLGLEGADAACEDAGALLAEESVRPDEKAASQRAVDPDAVALAYLGLHARVGQAAMVIALVLLQRVAKPLAVLEREQLVLEQAVLEVQCFGEGG